MPTICLPNPPLPTPPLPVAPVGGLTPVKRLLAATVVVLLALGGAGLAASPAQADSGDGVANAWGFNDGDGQTVIPSSLAGKDVIAVSSKDAHNLALTSDGHVTGWGRDTEGQTDVPASLADKKVTAVAAGCSHSLALTSDGHLTAWGGNGSGQTDVPASLADKTVTTIAAGCSFNLAVTSDGHLTAWGDNGSGQTDIPPALADKTVTAVSAGLGHSLAVTSEGQVFGWGENGSGQTNIPAFPDGTRVTAVAAGFFHSAALTSDGQVFAWGDSNLGQTQVPWWALQGRTVVAIAAGGYHTLALTSDGQVIGWGHNGQCQLCVPAPPAGWGYTAIAGGHLHSVGVMAPLPIDFTPGTTATISGKPQVGQTLTADGGGVVPDPSYAYRWFADDVPISGATGQTLVLTPAEQGAAITVEVSAAKHGYNTSTDTSAATAPVAGVTVTGTTTVGHTLRGSSSALSLMPAAVLTRQWLRDGSPIPGADGDSYLLTNADAGSRITFQVTETTDGVADAPVPSAEVGPVSGGLITLPVPTISGSPVVDGILSASLPAGELDPADAEVTWQWFRGQTRVGTGSTYTPGADDAGAVLDARATATKDYFNHVSQDAVTEQVAKATFATPPVATISGTLKVGQVLTAGAGRVAPAPDDLSYQWYADAHPIADATEATYTLTSAQKDSVIAVQVTATRAGYQDASDRSAATAPVATDLAPDLQLDAADPSLRRGQSTTLSWTSSEADTVTASGAWAGTRATSGSTSVRPTTLGDSTYVLEASNANGTTTTQATVVVTRPAKALAVTVPGGLHLAGAALTVSTRGLETDEPYVVRVGGTRVATGHADGTGFLSRSVTVPSRRTDGTVTVTVTGSATDRAGGTTASIVTNKTLGIGVAKQRVQRHHRQRVTVSGLASHERVTVRYRGRRVSPSDARADSLGRYQVTFRVGMRSGTKRVTATGQFPGRNATITFWVRRH